MLNWISHLWKKETPAPPIQHPGSFPLFLIDQLERTEWSFTPDGRLEFNSHISLHTEQSSTSSSGIIVQVRLDGIDALRIRNSDARLLADAMTDHMIRKVMKILKGESA